MFVLFDIASFADFMLVQDWAYEEAGRIRGLFSALSRVTLRTLQAKFFGCKFYHQCALQILLDRREHAFKQHVPLFKVAEDCCPEKDVCPPNAVGDGGW